MSLPADIDCKWACARKKNCNYVKLHATEIYSFVLLCITYIQLCRTHLRPLKSSATVKVTWSHNSLKPQLIRS